MRQLSNSKNITLFFEYFQKVHFGKDPFMVPYYLGKMLGYTVTIIYPQLEENKDLPSEYQGVKLIPIKVYGNWNTRPVIRYMPIYQYLRKNAKQIDIFMCFFLGRKSEWLTLIYKHYNPKGKVYIKMDINPFNIPTNPLTFSKKSTLHTWLKKKWINSFIKRVDTISCEMTEAYKRICNSNLPQYQWGEKLVIVPNGIDEEAIRQMNFGKPAFKEKENIMITVGRLGTKEKNNEMLLRTLEQIKLKDWKIYLIGSIEPEAKPTFDSYLNKNPEWKNKVIFTGPIYDKKILYNYFYKSKVFLLTSRFEGFAIVYAEAKRFCNYIVSTPVGAVYDVIGNGKYGKIVPQEDDKALAVALQNIIDEKTNIDVYDDFDVESLSWENQLKTITNLLK